LNDIFIHRNPFLPGVRDGHSRESVVVAGDASRFLREHNVRTLQERDASLNRISNRARALETQLWFHDRVGIFCAGLQQ
jgi:hypothetical protein